MLIIGLIIVLGILSVINSSKKPAEVIILVERNNFVCSNDEVVDNKHIIKDIKDEILFYANNINYRSREKIVGLLSNLQEYEDPGDFLDENPYICEYMFNRDVG